MEKKISDLKLTNNGSHKGSDRSDPMYAYPMCARHKWAVIILFLLFCPLNTFADQKFLYLSVGDEETVSLPSDFYGKKNGRGQWSNADPLAIDIISKSDYSIKIKVLKWVYHTCLIQYDYWYTDDFNYSRHITFDLSISIKKPTVELSASPSGGKIKKGETVYLSCTKYDAAIYYTLNGSTPTQSSSKYYSSGITIDKTCTLKAYASWGGVDSDILTEKYTVEDGLYLSANPSGGVVEKGTKVYLTASEYGADIYYTLDGYTPSRSSTPYSSSGITINEDCTLKAIAYKNNMTSDILSETYRLLVNPTEISVYLSSSTIKVGETTTANYSLKPSNASTTVTWTSEDPNIASVQSSTGKVVGVSEGTTNIIATTTNGLRAQCRITVSGIIDCYVNKDNFPDDNFCRSLLVRGISTEEDVRKTKILDVIGEGIKSLKGIEYFTSLEELYCTWNTVKSLDLSKNTKLRKLECVHCGLTTLDLSQNKLLKFLDCSLNSIKGAGMDNLINSLPAAVNGVFRVSRGSDNICTPTQVAAAKAKGWTPYYYDGVNNGKEIWLEYGGVEQNIIIDATNFPDTDFRNYLLNQDYGKDGKLTGEEITNISSLYLAEDGINNIKGIEHFTSLKYLSCIWIRLESLDLSQNTELREFECVHCRLYSLDLSNNTALTKLDCTLNYIKGSEMDKLINSLPIQTQGKFYVKRGEYDGNECTKTQVAAAKAKGWTPYYYDGYNNGKEIWVEYEGSDPTAIDGVVTDVKDDAPIYNLNGQRLDKPRKGINIIGGKKVVVK